MLVQYKNHNLKAIICKKIIHNKKKTEACLIIFYKNKAKNTQIKVLIKNRILI